MNESLQGGLGGYLAKTPAQASAPDRKVNAYHARLSGQHRAAAHQHEGHVALPGTPPHEKAALRVLAGVHNRLADAHAGLAHAGLAGGV